MVQGIAAMIATDLAEGYVISRIVKMLSALPDIPEDAAEAAVKLALARKLSKRRAMQKLTQVGGPALRGAVEQNRTYLAAYILSAARRLGKAALEGKLIEGIRAEQHWLAMHDFAQQKRLDSARSVDSAAKRYGALLGWYSVLDGRTTKECAESHGGNFYAERRPHIGWPGSVHSRCRCRPGRPHDTGRMLV